MSIAPSTTPSTTPVDRLRSLLFAPAVRPEMLAKLPATGADGVVIDCEDATPPGAKAEGREHARRVAPEIAGRGSLVFVRVNAVPSPWFAEDIVSRGVRTWECVGKAYERTKEIQERG